MTWRILLAFNWRKYREEKKKRPSQSVRLDSVVRSWQDRSEVTASDQCNIDLPCYKSWQDAAERPAYAALLPPAQNSI